MERPALTTAAPPRSTKPSAATRSRSSWSMTAISPGWILRRRFFVRRSTRARCAVDRVLRRATRRANLLHLEVDVGHSRTNIVVYVRLEREHARGPEGRPPGLDQLALPDSNIGEVDHDHSEPRPSSWADDHAIV